MTHPPFPALSPQSVEAAAARPRLLILDLLRTLALLGMAAYHLTWDLQMFGLVAPETATTGFFFWHARIVAGSFLFFAGLSLWLSHGAGIRWPAFWRREAKIAGAAVLVTLGTLAALPQAYVFFGILHSIAAGSLFALLFLRLPAGLTALAGLAILALPALTEPALNAPLLRFLGLASVGTQTVDLVPVFPWWGVLLLGLAAGRAFAHRLPRMDETPLLRTLAWPGRHTLAIYLIHQPVLFGAVWAVARFT